ncbi:MAG: PQQ-like beta-propeller repeat protein [Candidatus Coatesbacteria bacterium]|nr:PQQ-like beta-propeller repeat protein [Candidatus Coatesbacteria bacterium]
MKNRLLNIVISISFLLLAGCESDNFLPYELDNENLGRSSPDIPYYLWTESFTENNLGYAAIVGGKLVALSWDGSAYCMRTSNASLLWKQTTPVSYD